MVQLRSKVWKEDKQEVQKKECLKLIQTMVIILDINGLILDINGLLPQLKNKTYKL